MTRTIIKGAALVLAITALGGCSDLRKAVGIEKTSPDEFTVVQGPPLTVPPDFGLRPPLNSADAPVAAATIGAARSAVFGLTQPKAAAVETGVSPGENALLAHAGASHVDPQIRAQVDQETKAELQPDTSFAHSLVFWKDDAPPKHVVDAAAEAERLRENAALGKPVTDGNTPIIDRTGRTTLTGAY